LGIIGSVLILAGFFAVDEGGTELSGSLDEVVANLTSLHGRIVVGSIIGILGGLALFGFATSLRIRLSREGAKGDWLGSVVLASTVVTAIGAIVQGSLRIAVAAIVSTNAPPDEMVQLWRFDRTTDVLFWGCLALVVTMCTAAYTVRLLPRALAAVGLVLVLANIILMPTDHGGVGLTLLLWLIAACSSLITRSKSRIGT
ncbi:MAG TPA: hypothetical protein VLD62_10060, partial [Acidimicrobiia bacterium]|nr:hypothetical protein [Acidimicrobiia bacterium]